MDPGSGGRGRMLQTQTFKGAGLILPSGDRGTDFKKKKEYRYIRLIAPFEGTAYRNRSQALLY